MASYYNKKALQQKAGPAKPGIKSGQQLGKPKIKQSLGSTSGSWTPSPQQAVTQNSDSFSEVAANQPPTPPANPTYSASQSQASIGHSSYNPASGLPDVRDSEYWSNYAKILATAEQGYAAKQLEQSQADTEFELTQIRRNENRRRDVRNRAESLIGTGLLRSGYHNRAQTEATMDYLDETDSLLRSRANDNAARKAQMDALKQNLGIDEQALYAAATDRYGAKQAKAAADAQALAELAQEPGGTATAKKGKKKMSSQLIAAGTQHGKPSKPTYGKKKKK